MFLHLTCPVLTKVTDWAQEGYHKKTLADIEVRKWWYTTLYTRGSGPGGQGMQSSSNRVELRLNLELLASSDEFDESTIELLRKQQTSKICKAGDLIVASHEHRSALKNEEECVARVRTMLFEAGYVQPVAKPPHELPKHVLKKAIEKRRKKSYYRNAGRNLKAQLY